jgi:hypothetical protein
MGLSPNTTFGLSFYVTFGASFYMSCCIYFREDFRPRLRDLLITGGYP